MLGSFTSLLIWLAVVTARQHYEFDILENGALIRQNVDDLGDLQMIEVPAHADRLHVIIYLDHRSGLQMVKDVKNQKCQLSTMEPEAKMARWMMPKSSESPFMVDLPLLASAMEQVRVFKLERLETIQNISYIREELRQACAGLPIHWADSLDESQLDSMVRNNEIIFDQEHSILLKPMDPNVNVNQRISCNPDVSAVPVPDHQFNCHGFCFYQKCRVASHSCYFVMLCEMNGLLGQNCMKHAIHMGGQCKPCCNDPLSPGCNAQSSVYWRHCSCVHW